MCVAATGTVIEVGDKTARVSFNGNEVIARSGLVDVTPGDKVLVHAGCILQKVSEDEAKEIESIMELLES
ncbi:HypC/HybG/HupF family hydrogenase formation chaperone [Butyrivibrio sp. MC2013]|uniref:HypC/HybG/HupF family hydrogenase formation chaperone n=1 Tax=Butyrivibrio sp. MC2013 TaxID=1280686 RepID=UPI00040BFE54|nr:HypC/HybG/HupF family hydrogenase formation chaperone [Butyrivibrio sp. MC2013]